MLRHFAFSRHQQQTLAFFTLLYVISLCAAVTTEHRQTVESSPLRQSDPLEMAFYLDVPINLNRADALELQLLPGIGPVLADRILAHRQEHGNFASPDDLDAVKGVGPKTIQKLRPYLVCSE
ncbi:helix-hairpin-helix motif [Candidatus Moduliflexus flocculans]|uniref:Helix-hairpin-helix motif n=1 Tax=Candidatus Moduliflexus flocculans TaxID=1499966 RepID=A0A081BT75_9BACT|nr:helix-hairpin-helix motif [Candidatus Moduliflexus flocculans]